MKTQVKIQRFKNGHHSLSWPVPASWSEALDVKDWGKLDELASASLSSDGDLFEVLNSFCPIKKIEHILSLRSAPDEIGIWHDDGSRELAFSLSLNKIKFGGKGLSLRKKNQPDTALSLGFRAFGTLTLFLTGQDDYEHRTEEVTSGERLVLAGWIN